MIPVSTLIAKKKIVGVIAALADFAKDISRIVVIREVFLVFECKVGPLGVLCACICYLLFRQFFRGLRVRLCLYTTTASFSTSVFPRRCPGAIVVLGHLLEPHGRIRNLLNPQEDSATGRASRVVVTAPFFNTSEAKDVRAVRQTGGCD